MPPIKIKVTPKANLDKEDAKEEQKVSITLEARKTIDGKIMIMDHRDIDIVIDTVKKQIITFPKNEMSDEVYQTQNNYFDYLSKKGIVERNSVQGGDVYASIQGKYPDTIDENVSPAQLVLLNTYHFIESERPRFEAEEFYEDQIDDHYTDPDEEDTTELGEVPEEPRKGHIDPYVTGRYRRTFGPY